MNTVRFLYTLVLGLMLASPAAGARSVNTDPDAARIITADLQRFWRAFDAFQAAETPEAQTQALVEHYYRPASPGLRAFIDLRIGEARQLAGTLRALPGYYAALRTHMPRLAGVEAPVRQAFRRFHALYPQAVFPDVYLLIGRLSSGGTLSDVGLLLGVEMYGLYPESPRQGLSDWHLAVMGRVEDLPFVIVHELMHYQQDFGDQPRTLLAQSLIEGGADYVAGQVMGRIDKQALHDWARPREAALWAEFKTVMHGEDYGDWLYAGSRARGGRPADLGYFFGYRIAEAHHARRGDLGAAIAEILRIGNARAFLDASGYDPE
jgi:hypothetical protein